MQIYGAEILYVKVDSNGFIDLDHLANLISEDVAIRIVFY